MSPLDKWFVVCKHVVSDNFHPISRYCFKKLKLVSGSIVNGGNEVDTAVSDHHFLNLSNHQDIRGDYLQHHDEPFNISCTLDAHFVR